jgi:hypothetical protein
MDETATQAVLKQFYDTTTDDVIGASDIYADDAVLEFPHGKERIRGTANIIAFRSAYPRRRHNRIAAGDRSPRRLGQRAHRPA